METKLRSLISTIIKEELDNTPAKKNEYTFHYYAWIPSYRDFDIDEIDIDAVSEEEAWKIFNEKVKYVKSAGIGYINGEKYVPKEDLKENLDEMARIPTMIAIGNPEKLEKAKKLFGEDSWIGKMIKAVETGGEKGITRDAMIDAADKNQLTINPKVKDFLDIGLFKEVGLETAKKEKPETSGFKGRPISVKSTVARNVDQKLQDDNNYKASAEEVEALGAEFIEKLRKRVKGELKRGRPADPNKVKSTNIKTKLKDLMAGDDEELNKMLASDEEDILQENKTFKHMQKLAGLNENEFRDSDIKNGIRNFIDQWDNNELEDEFENTLANKQEITEKDYLDFFQKYIKDEHEMDHIQQVWDDIMKKVQN